MQIKNGKDFWAGLMFVGFGAAFVIIARDYPMGQALRMGPAYFPTVLGGLLVILGMATFVRSFFSKVRHSWKLFEFRPANFVAAMLLGGYSYWQLEWLNTNDWLKLGFVGAALLLFFSSFGKRSLWQVLMATLAFGYLLKPLGLVAAVFLLVVGAGVISEESKPLEVVVLAVVLALFAWLTFVVGLNQPFPAWPEFITG